MLATLAVLPLLAAASLSQAATPPATDAPHASRERLAQASDGSRGESPPPMPPPEEPPGGSAPSGEAGAPDGTGARGDDGAAPPGRPRQLSLLSAESLRGGSAALAWAGWPSFGAAYAIGFTPRDDGGLFFSHDWEKSELRIGALYRRPISPAGPFDAAFRLTAAWYENFGSTYIHDENHSDRGMEFAPGLSFSSPGAGGIFSILLDAPMTITWKYKTGFLFSPRASVAFESVLYPRMTVGALAGLGYRAGSGDAPLRDGRGELRFLVLAGYQLL